MEGEEWRKRRERERERQVRKARKIRKRIDIVYPIAIAVSRTSFQSREVGNADENPLQAIYSFRSLVSVPKKRKEDFERFGEFFLVQFPGNT